jgi:DNA polymerase I-like protein with 3'-5' exonuclease and polymerase domains
MHFAPVLICTRNLAQRIFGGTEKDHKKGTTRLAAKAVNFGIPMGMTNIGLCIELRKNGVDVNEDDAQRWLNETMSLYADVPEVPAEQNCRSSALRVCHGPIRGRRRYIGGIRSWDDAVRSEAERFAFSTPIQAGAQEIMKIADRTGARCTKFERRRRWLTTTRTPPHD